MPKKEHVSIEDLRRVAKIAELHSAKKAAKAFGVADSVIATSKDMVQQLAAKLASDGAVQQNALFKRGTSLETTFRGEQFVKDVREVLQHFDKMVENMQRPDSPKEGKVKMYISDLLMATVAIPAISELARQSDYKVSITIKITPSIEAMNALADHEANLVVTLSENYQDHPSHEDRFESMTKINSPLVVMATENFRLPKSGELLSEKKEVSLVELHESGTPLALPPDSFTVRRLVDRLLGSGNHADPVLVVNSISHLRHYARTGCAATILPEITAISEVTGNGLIMRPLKGADSLHTSFCIYKNVGKKLDPATKLLAETLGKHLLEFDKRSTLDAG